MLTPWPGQSGQRQRAQVGFDLLFDSGLQFGDKLLLVHLWLLEPEHGVIRRPPELIPEMGVSSGKAQRANGLCHVLSHLHGNQAATAAREWTRGTKRRGLGG